MTPKPKRIPKYKTRIKILDSGALCGVCLCGWSGNAIAQTAGLDKAMAAVQSEIQGHTHVPKPKKEKNAKVSKKEF